MNIQALFGVGLIIGMIAFAVLADKKGRKYSFLASQYTLIVAISFVLFGIWGKNPVLMGVGQFLIGFGGIVNVNLSFTIAREFFSDKWRQRSVVYYCSGMYLFDKVGEYLQW